MANGRTNGRATNLQAEISGLWERARSTQSALDETRGGMDHLDKKIDSVALTLNNKMEDGFTRLGQKFEARAITPWGTLIAAGILMLAGMTAVGGLALQPRDSAIENLRSELLRDRDATDQVRLELARMMGEQLALQRLEGRERR